MDEPTIDELRRRLADRRKFAGILASVPFQARNHRLLFQAEAEAEEIEREIRQRTHPTRSAT